VGRGGKFHLGGKKKEKGSVLSPAVRGKATPFVLKITRSVIKREHRNSMGNRSERDKLISAEKKRIEWYVFSRHTISCYKSTGWRGRVVEEGAQNAGRRVSFVRRGSGLHEGGAIDCSEIRQLADR